MELLAWVDGDLVPVHEARISAFDQGFRTGEGVFETLRAYGGHVFRLDAHVRRAAEGARALEFHPGDHDRLAHAVTATAAANLAALNGQDSAVRLTVTPGRLDPTSPFPGEIAAGPTVVVTSHPLAPDPAMWERGVTALTVPWSRQLPQIKAVSYLAASTARRRARRHGAYEALLTSGGNVLEGASSNVFAVVDGTLVTPPVEAGLLAGVTRAVVLELAAAAGLPTVERSLAVDELAAAEEAMLTSTTREIVPLVAIDGAPVGSGRPGATTMRLLAAYRDEVARSRGGDPA